MLHQPSQGRQHILLVFILALGFSTGCGKNDPFMLVPVSGKVTFEDGSMIDADFITVTFVPLTPAIDAKTHPRLGQAQVDAKDGTFDNATTHRFADGVTTGKHKILIKAFDADMNLISAISHLYADPATTPLEVDSNDSPFHFKIVKERTPLSHRQMGSPSETGETEGGHRGQD